ncbi:MAG: YtxH domain-containing protein [Candidatus Omnitrophica bacterium]|nr:YtxH domain-containing protein [Candidatus Omnitrophota bacterium]
MKARGKGKRIAQTVAAFSAGATLGSLLALLYAPASGNATRRRIGMQVRSFQKTATRKLQRTGRGLVSQAKHAGTAASHWINQHVPNGNGRQAIRRRRVHHASA